ncbi:MAG: hypothetical protein V2I76_08210 [Roseobacter sp.]|jgi:hypothetical protein|nr:hypothetical protein [Roseobacter sp.]
MQDFWTDEPVRTLKEIEAAEYDCVISEYAPETEAAIEPAIGVSYQQEYILHLMAAFKTAMDAGTYSPDILIQNVKRPKHEDRLAHDDRRPMNVERIWTFDQIGWWSHWERLKQMSPIPTKHTNFVCAAARISSTHLCGVHSKPHSETRVAGCR